MFLALAKLKHLRRGYSTPKPFALDEPDRCIDYDVEVADKLLAHLDRVGGSVAGAHVLELGPGSDLGLGLYLVGAKGASSYTAFDRHNLAENVPAEFYERLGERLGITPAFDQVRYVAREDFDLGAALEPASIDLVISNAAFEHFDDVGATARQLATVVKPGGRIVAEIDLQTHSRWIREQDPNNIYRYPRWLYRAFYFPGQPNRVRPDQYREHFESNGWRDVTIEPVARFDPGRTGVRAEFRDEHLGVCAFVLCATRS